MTRYKLHLTESELQDWNAACEKALVMVNNALEGSPPTPEAMRAVQYEMHRLALRESIRHAAQSARG